MQPEISYIVQRDSLKSAAIAAGITLDSGPAAVPCALHVGDIFSTADSPGLFFRVTARWFVFGNESQPPRWYLTIDAADDPTAPP